MKVNGYTIHPIALGPHGPLAQITQHAHSEAHDRLLIADMANTDEGAHTPAASVQIFGRPALLSLRDKLVEIYPLPAADSGPLVQQRDELLSTLQSMVRAYVGLMESGRERIISLGGKCDAVDVMERSDPWLRNAAVVIAKVKGGAT